MSWILLIMAGCFEVVGVIGMNQIKKRKHWTSVATLVVGMVLSFFFLMLAMKSLSMGTAYAIWTGIGTVGGTLVGMFLYGESKDFRRILFIAMVLIAVIGLKVIA